MANIQKCKLNITHFYFREFKSTIKCRGTIPIPLVVGTKQTKMSSDYKLPKSTKFVDYYYPCFGFFGVMNIHHVAKIGHIDNINYNFQQRFVCTVEKHFTNAIQYFQHQDSIHYGIFATNMFIMLWGLSF